MQFLHQNHDILVTQVHQALHCSSLWRPLQTLTSFLEAQQAATSDMSTASTAFQRPWQNVDLRGVLRRAWDHLRQARSHRTKSLSGLFYAWRHAAQVFRLIQSTRRMCRSLRRQKLLAILNKVNMFHISRTWQASSRSWTGLPPKEIGYGNSKGGVLDIQEEASANAAFMQRLYVFDSGARTRDNTW